jgi:hypothetical protein
LDLVRFFAYDRLFARGQFRLETNVYRYVQNRHCMSFPFAYRPNIALMFAKYCSPSMRASMVAQVFASSPTRYRNRSLPSVAAS